MGKRKIPTTPIIIIYISLVIILLLIAAPYISDLLGHNEELTRVGYSSETVRARVISIQEEGTKEFAGREQRYQYLEIQILEGFYQDSSMVVEVGKNQYMPDEYQFKAGDILLVNAAESPIDGNVRAFFVDFVRERSILIILLIFGFTAILIGGKTGFRSLIGSAVGLAIIVLFIIPQILNGGNPLLISIIGAMFFMGLSLYIVYGFNRMTHSAVMGMLISLILTGGFSIIAVYMSRLTGVGDESMMFLLQLTENQLDMRGILLAGIIISSLGVLDDLVIGQSSAIFQLIKTKPGMSLRELYSRGISIGRDHVAASVNTLILAYAGESLPMILLFTINNVDLRMAANVSYIAEEIVQALAGTTGLFLSVPVTTLIASLVASRGTNNPKENFPEHKH